MAAKRRKSKIKNGYMIDVNFRGRASFQSHETSAESANEVVKICNENLLLIQTGNLPWNGDWSKPEKLHLIRHGKIHPDLETINTEGDPQDLTFQDGFDKWKTSINWKRRSEQNNKDYVRKISFVISFLKSNGVVKIKDLKRKHLNDLIGELNSMRISKGNINLGKKYKWNSIKNFLLYLKQNLIWLKQEDWISNFNSEAFLKLEYGGREKSSYDELEYQSFDARVATLERSNLDASNKDAFRRCWYSELQLIEHVDFLKSKLWLCDVKQTKLVEKKRRLFCSVMFAIYTASRRVEVARACCNHIDWRNETITLWRKKGKKRHEKWNRHETPVHPELLDYLQYGEWLSKKDGQQSLFCSNDKHILSSSSYDEKKTINKAGSMSDALKRALNGSIYANIARWHIYRHTLCSIYAQKQVSPKLIQDLIGWRTDEIMKLYNHVDDRDLREVQRLLNLNRSQNVHGLAVA